jgi:hypothetical protein
MADAIEAVGLATFLDVNDIEVGDEIGNDIRKAIRNCFEFVVLVTPASLDRRYVWMEIGAAWVLRKRIVAVLYQITPAEIATASNIPAILKDINVLDLNEFEKYIKELRGRARKTHAGKRKRD